MDTLIVLIVLALVAVVAVALFARRRNGVTEVPAAPPRAIAPTDGDPELQRLLAAGNTIGAIKRARELTGLGLKEAKDYVESLPVVSGPVDPAPVVRSDPAGDAELQRLLVAGNTIGAIKRARELTGWGLKEAKDYVERLPEPAPVSVQAEHTPAATGDPAADAEVRRLLAAGNTIGAIKRVRELTGWGLKEAKDYVDRM